MKLSANSVLTAMCLALSSGAMAAPSVDVAIKGWVKPGACDITLSEKSVLNIPLGSFFTANLNEYEQTILKEPLFENILVRCMTKTKVSIVVSDNRAAFVVDGAKPSPLWDESYHFGLGAGQAGNYILLVNSRAFDLWLGGDWATLHSEDSGATWERRSDRTAFKPATTHRIAFAKDQEMVPSAIAYARVGIAPVVAIRKTSSLDLSSQIVIDGSASFTLHYD